LVLNKKVDCVIKHATQVNSQEDRLQAKNKNAVQS